MNIFFMDVFLNWSISDLLRSVTMVWRYVMKLPKNILQPFLSSGFPIINTDFCIINIKPISILRLKLFLKNKHF